MNDFELNQNTNRLAAACTQSSPETGIREFLYTYSPDPAARGRFPSFRFPISPCFIFIRCWTEPESPESGSRTPACASS